MAPRTPQPLLAALAEHPRQGTPHRGELTRSIEAADDQARDRLSDDPDAVYGVWKCLRTELDRKRSSSTLSLDLIHHLVQLLPRQYKRLNFFKDYSPADGGDVIKLIHVVYKSLSEHVMDAARRGSLTTKELDVFEDLCEAVETTASYHNSKAFARRFAEALACELLDGIVCDATDLYAFARRAALRTLAVVVNPKKRNGCPDGARYVAALLASDDYAVAADTADGSLGGAAAGPSSLRAFWRAASVDGDEPSMLFGSETLAYACAFVENGTLHLEDVVRCLKGAKASFGALVKNMRSGETDHHGARREFKRLLDGVVDDYVAGLGDAAPCKRVPAREIVVAGAGEVRGASVLFWRRGIGFEFAFEDAPEEAQRVDVPYATCLRSVSEKKDSSADADVYGLTSRGGSVVALGISERPRGFGRGDAVDVRDDAFIAFAFDANRFAQATASLARPAAEYPGAFGAAGRARFLEARRAASPLKTSRGVACVVAGPPKPLAPIRTARLPKNEGGSQRTCQTDLTSPRTAETFLGANKTAESPEPPFLTARTDASPSPAGRFDAERIESRDKREPSPSPSPSPSQKTSRGIAHEASPDAKSPSPRSPSPTPSPPPPPPSAARTRRRGAKAPEREPEQEPPAPAPRRSTRLTRSAAATEPAPAAGESRKAEAAAPAKPARAAKKIVEAHECAADELEARTEKTFSAARAVQRVPAKRIKRKAAKGSADAREPASEARAAPAETDEPNPRAGKTRRVASRFFEPAAPATAAAPAPAAPAAPPASAPAQPPASTKPADRGGKARRTKPGALPTKEPPEDAAADAFEAFRLGNERALDAVGDGGVSPRVADAARAAEAGFWFSPRSDTSRRGVFARDGAAPKQAARRGRSKSPFADRAVGATAADDAVPPSPRASVSPPASARAPEPARDRSGTVPAAAAISPADPFAAGTVALNPPRASPPTPRTSKKKSLLKGKGFETPRGVSAPKTVAEAARLERDAPPTNVTVLDAAEKDFGGDENEEEVPYVPEQKGAEKQKAEEPKGRAEQETRKKPKNEAPGASSKKRAPRSLARKKRAQKPPVAEPEPEPAVDDWEAHAPDTEQAQEETPAPEAPEGVESPASVSEDAFEKAFNASAEFVVREFEPAPRAGGAEKRAAAASPSYPSGFVAAARPAPAAEPSPCSRADEVEQRARRAAASEADAWTAAEVPTLFKLSEKASSREERRKWEIILDVVLARKAATSPSPTPSPGPVIEDVSKSAKRGAFPAPERTETLPGEKKTPPRPAKKKRRRVDAHAENVASPSSESAGVDADPAADPADDSDDEVAALEKRLRSMRTTRKERAEMEIAAMAKRFKEDTQAQAAALEAEATRACEAAVARRAEAEETNKARVARIVDAFAAEHQTFKDAARDACEAFKEAEVCYARDLEEAAAEAEAERATLLKRAETLAARAAARAEETSRVVAKKRKDAATGNSLKSLLLRLAEQM